MHIIDFSQTFRAVVAEPNEAIQLAYKQEPIESYSEPTVYIFDRRGDHTPNGQLVSSYFLNTFFQKHTRSAGLCLVGGVPEWQLSSNEVSILGDLLCNLGLIADSKPNLQAS